MKRRSARRALWLLLLVLLWRLLGAPTTAAQWSDVGTPLWQMRTLLPDRALRIWQCWTAAFPRGETPEVVPTAAFASTQTVRVLDAASGLIAEMPLEEYVVGVLAAEMPAAYHAEALCAQAVAARTRAFAQAAHGGCSACVGADVCTDSAHCQGYLSAEARAEKWGATASAYEQRLREAVKRTEGTILTYAGEPITVLYHAISGGHTEDAQAVFSQSVPYLTGVESSGEEDARGFYADAAFSFEEAAKKLSAFFDDASISAATIRDRFAISTHTETGRVSTMLLGSREVPATEVRKALGLRSTWFTLSVSGETIVFHQQGYGHGVGMSQAGANRMAAEGADYASILSHYYLGTELAQAGTFGAR